MSEPSEPPETDEQRRAAGLPPEPRSPGDPPVEVDPPQPVAASFWLWIGAGVVFIVGYVATLLGKQRIVDQVVETNNDPSVTPEQIDSGLTSLIWILIFGAAVFAVLFALFAYKAREGTRSARTVLTVLTVVTLAFQLLLQLASIVTLFATLLAVIALVLLYLPSVAWYFPKVTRSGAAVTRPRGTRTGCWGGNERAPTRAGR